MLLIILPLLLIALFLIFGFLWFMPEFRAQYYMWRGRQEEARKILEYLLVQNPERVSLYRKLGDIYYRENRQDKRALKIYEMILKLKLQFEWRDEIYTLVAKYYISEGRKDSEAIRVIEKAVDKEIKRLTSFA